MSLEVGKYIQEPAKLSDMNNLIFSFISDLIVVDDWRYPTMTVIKIKQDALALPDKYILLDELSDHVKSYLTKMSVAVRDGSWESSGFKADDKYFPELKEEHGSFADYVNLMDVENWSTKNPVNQYVFLSQAMINKYVFPAEKKNITAALKRFEPLLFEEIEESHYEHALTGFGHLDEIVDILFYLSSIIDTVLDYSNHSVYEGFNKNAQDVAYYNRNQDDGNNGYFSDFGVYSRYMYHTYVYDILRLCKNRKYHKEVDDWKPSNETVMTILIKLYSMFYATLTHLSHEVLNMRMHTPATTDLSAIYHQLNKNALAKHHYNLGLEDNH